MDFFGADEIGALEQETPGPGEAPSQSQSLKFSTSSWGYFSSNR
jgi:hypothetical protein